MKGAYRVLLYLAIWLAITTGILVSNYVSSQAAYDAGDRSAFAWMGFLPFLIPIIAGYVSFYGIPVVLVIEGFLWWRRKP